MNNGKNLRIKNNILDLLHNKPNRLEGGTELVDGKRKSNLVTPINLADKKNRIKNGIFDKLQKKGIDAKESVANTQQYIEALKENATSIKNLSELIAEYNKSNREIALSDKKTKDLETKAILDGFQGVILQLKEQGKFEKTTINLGDIEKLLKSINEKPYPETQNVNLSLIESELKEISSKEVDVETATGILNNLYDVLLKTWLPEENAIQVVVKNQIKPVSGGGGVIPFKNSENVGVKALVGSDGRLEVNTNNVLVEEKYDYVGVAYPLDTTEVYTFKLGGSLGDTVATVTIVYTDATKNLISTVTKT